MRIVADENIPLVDAFFSGIGEVSRVPGRSMSAGQVREADILLVRSVTPVGPELLQGSRVRFVASATIGTDHIDLPWLQRQNIGFSSAPGCNADSVVDYVLSALFQLAAETGEDLGQKQPGIVGVGNVGGRLQQRLSALGYTPVLNDPPRAVQDSGELRFTELEALVEQCDLICLHTPLTRQGEFPSFHLFDESLLERLRPGTWLLNAGRGGAIDNRALSALLDRRPDLRVVLDVWEGEPAIDPQLAAKVSLATPHIAGYSMEGRMRGTEMIYQAVCRHLQRRADITLAQLLPAPAVATVELNDSDEDLLPSLVGLRYDLCADHRRLMRLMHGSADQRAQGFDRLRKEYPVRREFSSLTVKGLAAGSTMAARLAAAGFDVTGH